MPSSQAADAANIELSAEDRFTLRLDGVKAFLNEGTAAICPYENYTEQAAEWYYGFIHESWKHNGRPLSLQRDVVYSIEDLLPTTVVMVVAGLVEQETSAR